MKFLLDYFFPITVITPTPAASTAYLKQVCVLAIPKMGVTAGTIVKCTSMAAVAAVTDNGDSQALFDAGMTSVYILPVNDLDVSADLVGHEKDFFTMLISSDFDKDDVNPTAATGTVTISSYANLVSGSVDTIAIAGTTFTAQSGAATLGDATFQAATSNNATAASLAAQINAHATAKTKVTATVLNAVVTITSKTTGSSSNAYGLVYTDNDTNVGASVSAATLTGGDGFFQGAFKGVVGVASSDETFLEAQAIIDNRCSFYAEGNNGSKNMFFAFGKLLSNLSDWKNQQYITMPLSDDVANLGDSLKYFDNKISFVISDSQFGNRLALFCAGGKAIVAPYIIENLILDVQSKALQYVSANEPAYTHTQAGLIEDECQKVIDGDGQPNGNPGYIGRGWITAGKIDIRLVNDDFVATGAIDIAPPKALWRIEGQLSQTLGGN